MRNIRKWGSGVLLGAAAACFSFAVNAGAAACKEDIFIGQPMTEVAKSCPFPTLKDHRDLWEEELEGKTKQRRATVYDEWTFDTGAQEFMQSLIFLNGKLAEIRTLGYGSLRDPMMPDCRNGETLAVGDTMVDAYLKCGEPLATEKQKEKIKVTVEGEITRRSSIAVVEWTYRYGPDRPGYTIRFENGQGAEIRPRVFGK